MSKDQMAVACPSFKEMAQHMLGCSYHFVRDGEKKCYIYIANDKWLRYNKVSIGAVRRHEIAHCNGWPGDHPKENPPAPMSRESAPPPMVVK